MFNNPKVLETNKYRCCFIIRASTLYKHIIQLLQQYGGGRWFSVKPRYANCSFCFIKQSSRPAGRIETLSTGYFIWTTFRTEFTTAGQKKKKKIISERVSRPSVSNNLCPPRVLFFFFFP